MNKNYRIRGITLLPVHIGGGVEYLLDPFAYVVKDGWFYQLDMGALFSANPGFAQEFLRLSEQKFYIISLRNLVSKSFDPAERQTWLFRSRISAEFEREYKEKLTDSDNQLLVQCMLHENGRAIIPGSSIKGAFRTAVLDGRFNYEKQKQHAEELQSFPDKKRANIVEGLILSAIKEGRHGEEFCIEKDPFRGLKIGDAVLPEDCTEIIKVQNVHINDTARTEGITMWVEAVAINTSFDFSLSLLPDSQLTIIDKKIKKDELVKASYNFFATALNNEDEKYYRNNKAASDAVQMVCRQPDNVPF